MASFPDIKVLADGFAKYGYEIPKDAKKIQVGKGEQGRVFKATRISIGKPFAVKVVIPLGDCFSEKEKRDFQREVNCMAIIKPEPYVVSVIDQFSIENIALCYVMDYIDAPDLAKLLARKKFAESPRIVDNTIDILWQIAIGLDVVHKAGVIHRDIKESNILVEEAESGGYHARITDFGFGYKYETKVGSPPNGPGKDSSYFVEAKLFRKSGVGIDYYCFGKLIEGCINRSKDIKQSNLSNSLNGIVTYLKDTCSEVSKIADAPSHDKAIILSLADLRRRSTIFRVDPTFSKLLAVPELTDVGDGDVIRLSSEMTVPLTRRIVKVIDSSPFQRLRSVSQLANTQLVYPGAAHSRFEHSIGVYNIARMVLRRLLQAEAFLTPIERKDVEKLLLAALLHDIGHIPHSHLLEEVKLYNHEKSAHDIILNTELSDLIKQDWQTTAQDVATLIAEDVHTTNTDQILSDILSKALDIDTMDYLIRDSIHLGVPYGLTFDRDRLIFSLTINEKGDSLAITHKGIVPAETFLIARYALFSQVYAHHTVRAVTAMFQRAIWERTKNLSKEARSNFVKTLKEWDSGDLQLYHFCAGRENTYAHNILGPLAKYRRVLFKRFWNVPEDLYTDVASFDYDDRVLLVYAIVDELKKAHTSLADIKPWQVLLDLPGTKFQEVTIQVYYEKEQAFRKISTESPLIKALNEVFAGISRKARLFVSSKNVGKMIFDVVKDDDLKTVMKTAILQMRQKKQKRKVFKTMIEE